MHDDDEADDVTFDDLVERVEALEDRLANMEHDLSRAVPYALGTGLVTAAVVWFVVRLFS